MLMSIQLIPHLYNFTINHCYKNRNKLTILKGLAVKLVLMALLLSGLSNTQAIEPKSSSKSKFDLANKAAEEQRLKEEREDEFEEKNRWIWRYTLNNKEVYWLHTSNRPAACKGNLQAHKTRWQLNQHEIIQELCWYKNPGEAYITIVDPQAYLFSTTKIDAAKFEYIPSNKEKKAAAMAERNRQLRDALVESYSRHQREEKAKVEGMASPTIMNINGNLVMCIKIGVILDCN